MNQLYTYQKTRVLKDNIIHIKRQLPGGQGALRVAVGQEVSPSDILGEGAHFSGFRTIHLARELGVNPKRALSYLKRPLGKNIYQGEMLALCEGFLGFKKKVLISPIDGVLDYYDEKSGDLKVKLLPKPLKLISGVYGLVEDINQSSGSVIIKTQATIIYGVLGTGKERSGMLKALGSFEDLIGVNQILPDTSSDILVGGGLVSLDALEKAVSLGVGGFISGGIGFKDYKSMGGSGMSEAVGNWYDLDRHWADVGITLMVTEGFGLIPIGEDIFGALKKHDGKFAIIDGNSKKLILPSQDQNSMMCVRKISLPKVSYAKIITEKEMAELKVGSGVRVISTPFLAFQGTIEAIDKSQTKLPSGVTTYMITIATPKKKIKMPYQNLEIIG